MVALRSLFITATAALLVAGCQQQPQAVAACDVAVTPIHSIQGSAMVSSLLGQQVTVRGVVLASWQAEEQLGGFYLHSLEHDNDQDVTTSEALFVATDSGFPELTAGQTVLLSGTVSETAQVTGLSQPSLLQSCGEQALPAAQLLQLPVTSMSQFEALENMPVRFAQTLVVTGHYPLARHGQFQVAAQQQFTATQISAPGADAYAANQQALLGRLSVDDNKAEKPAQISYPSPELTATNTLRSGDSVSQLVGLLSEFNGSYQLQPTQQPQFSHSNPRPANPPAPAEQTLRIAAFNVLNYFNGNGPDKTFPTDRGAKTAADFARQHDKIISALTALNADIIGLMEIENDGYGSSSAIVELTTALRQHSGHDWRFVNAAQAQDSGRFGTDSITNGLLYRADRVKPHSDVITSRQAPFGTRSRPPLVQQFQALHNSELFAVAVNHFKSKGSCPRDGNQANADQADGQGCWNAVRLESAQLLTELMQQSPLNTVEHSVLLGDFNAYAMEDPITWFKQNGYHNRIEVFEPQGYSYVFNGFAGSLDHILVSTALHNRVVMQRHWSINADEPTALQYDMHRSNPNWVDSSPFRASDHDPVYVDIQF
ncbi:ExeM/NucH family extracellular endonuclease [Pseudidiomarina mangrovi]|uniref:ExeM/NucH family extracellular endonuclease n=1 Tax=Pseudidiomarina mangrovi TaxID=2487133 RepID=UPI000FCB85C1|nr:ExeM/NucH family extracellular endonuclease [Pseudidiomarina mangrovi]